MKLGVLMGGVSSERDISILSGEEIIKNLDKNKYEVFPILINKKSEVLDKVKGLDFVFLALHGIFGEDGTIQALLDSIEMPYSGCGMLTSAICMDKEQTKRILKAENINVAPHYIINSNTTLNFDLIETLEYPIVVKPNNGGSSIGTSIVSNRNELKAQIAESFKYDTTVMLEKFISGDEYTVPVLNGKVLPVLSIKPNDGFFDYHSKYTEGETEEIVANLDNDLKSKIEVLANRCWEIFNCKAYVRIDIIVSNEVPYVLELNTLPGMTKNSLFPKSAAAFGMDYSTLLEKIIEES